MKIHSIFKVICLTLVSIILLSYHAHAEEKIEDAFGKKLGAFFDISTAIGKSSLTDGTPMYQFTPQNRFRSFDRYFVLITPKTKKIYGIWAIGNVKNTSVGEKEQAVIMSLLKKKYGESKKEGLFDDLMGVTQINHGNRYIAVKVSGFMDVTIDIRYYDRALKEIAEKERIELEAEKVDDGGL